MLGAHSLDDPPIASSSPLSLSQRPSILDKMKGLFGQKPAQQHLDSSRDTDSRECSSELEPEASARPPPPSFAIGAEPAPYGASDIDPAISTPMPHTPSPLLACPHPRLGPYYLRQTLGTGSFSKVRLGVHVADPSELVALKMVQRATLISNTALRRSMFLEIFILKYLASLPEKMTGIVPLKSVLLSNHYLALIQPYAACTLELFHLVSVKGRLSEPVVYHVFSQLLKTVRRLHEANVVHRDLKLENVLIVVPQALVSASLRSDSGENLMLSDQEIRALPETALLAAQVKLVDFGLATLLSESATDASTAIQHSDELLRKGDWSGQYAKFEALLLSAPSATLSLSLSGDASSAPLIHELFAATPHVSPPLSPSLAAASPGASPILLSTRCGSEEYAPPELLRGLPYHGPSSDLWSMGVLLYGMSVGCLPFSPASPPLPYSSAPSSASGSGASSPSAHHSRTTSPSPRSPTGGGSGLLQSIVRGVINWPAVHSVSDELKALIAGLLKIRPEDRWSVDRIQSCAWWMRHSQTSEPARDEPP